MPHLRCLPPRHTSRAAQWYRWLQPIIFMRFYARHGNKHHTIKMAHLPTMKLLSRTSIFIVIEKAEHEGHSLKLEVAKINTEECTRI